jgi:hypothetical protein
MHLIPMGSSPTDFSSDSEPSSFIGFRSIRASIFQAISDMAALHSLGSALHRPPKPGLQQNHQICLERATGSSRFASGLLFEHTPGPND